MTVRSAFRIFSRTIAALVLLVLLALGGGLYWLGTQHALEWLARRAVEMSEGRLEIDSIQGSLYDRINVSRAAFKDSALTVEARAIVLAWQPRALLKREARIDEVFIGHLRIATAAQEPTEPAQLPATLRLPLNATIGNARIDRIEIVPGEVVHDLRFRLRARADAHQLDLENVAAQGWRAAGTIRIGAATPFAVAGKLDLDGKALGDSLNVRVVAGGRLEALQLQASTTARGGTAMAAALLRPFSAAPLAKLAIDATDIDLAAWDQTLPRTKAGISVTAGMPAPDRIAGTVNFSNDLPGPIDAQRLPLPRASVAFAGEGASWAFSDIDVGIGRTGRAQGSGSLEGTRARFELTLTDIATADLHRRLQPLSVSGRAMLSGDPDSKRVTASLAAAGARLEIAARHAQQTITVERGELRAEDGRLEFSGRTALTGRREFSARAEFSGLDPARFVTAPPARLNGKISAQGVLAPEWRSDVQLTVSDSRLRGEPLSANAEFTTSAKQLFSGSARAVLAGNRVEANGRFGAPGDQLKWTVDASNLKAVDAALAGSVNARGTFAGGIDQPSIEFNLTARGISAGTVAVRTIEAQGAVDAAADAALRLSAQAAGVNAGAMRLEELQLNAQGTRSRHEIEARVRGAETDASIKGAGGLDQSWRWIGTVTALEARGRVPFRLTAPARITASRDLVEIDGVRAAVLGGEVGPASIRLADGRLTTRGALTGITGKALLAIGPVAGVDARDFAIGGQWDLAIGEILSGSAEIHRQTGDLVLVTEKNLPLGLAKLDLRLSAQGDALEAALDAQSTSMGALGARVRTRIEKRDGAWAVTRDAPLDGNVSLDMQSLAWVRALAPQLDLIRGRLAATLAISGTAGAPLITGEAAADEVAVRAIGPGLHLSDGTLRAAFDGKQLKVSKLHLTAGDGRIEAEGVADLSDGLKSLEVTARAERARILSSPELTVVMSGTGRAGLRDLRLALEGKFKIDEGRYDLGSERRPELDEDVIIAGRTPAPEPGAKPVRIGLDVTVDLNDNFAVRGHGLDAVLGGSIRLTTRADALHALGTIRIVRGDYLAFGQLLNIQRGELSFSGPLGNPGIDLRAGRKIRTVEVGVEVGGSLSRPVVKLVSDPVMPDSERLGWLLLGRNPQTASAAELAMLQAMALTSDPSRSTSVQQKVAEGLGLDEFGVSHGGDGSVGVVALGKRITDRLTVRLEQGLGGTAGGLLKIDFLLTERWRLEGTAGAENAADVLFTLRFD